MERQFLFKCPRTGMNVQHRLEDDRPEERPANTHVPVRCPACMALHFVNSTARPASCSVNPGAANPI